MKPVAIVRHWHTEGPGYFAIALERRALPWRLLRIDAGDAVPEDPRAFSGIAFMGGPMSVNDPLPWIGSALRLIRAAVDADVPVIGHCLGGQLMAAALGAVVKAGCAREIGWGEVAVANAPVAQRWFGAAGASFQAFHWHAETFSIPRGGQALLSSRHCAHQAFALGKHIGMQCHIEMTAELVESWCCAGASEIEAHPGPGVQTAAQMLRDLDRRLAQLHAIADCVYGRWMDGLG